MGEPVWMEGDRAEFDAGAFARHEVTADVENHFVRVDIGMVVRSRDRQWVVIELAWDERTDDEVRAGEGLVHGRGLMDPAGDRLEVGDIEGVRIKAAVPADHIKGM